MEPFSCSKEDKGKIVSQGGVKEEMEKVQGSKVDVAVGDITEKLVK